MTAPTPSGPRTLRQQYPYLYAHGYDIGSQTHYVDLLAEVAAEDGVPGDVYVRRDWPVQARHPRSRDLAEAAFGAGQAVFTFDEHGDQQRVYFRAGAITDPDRRATVEQYAQLYAAGSSPLHSGLLPLAGGG